MSAYGLRSNNQGFLPVMTLSAPVVAVKSIRQGGGVSYGYTWKADADGFLALVGLGYADGFDRAWGNRINAHRGESLFPAVGRVAMDAHTVSTGNEELTVGDMLTYFGVLGTSCIYAEELALSVGGSPLTVTANLGLRIARVVS
jgi:alanine racemase